MEEEEKEKVEREEEKEEEEEAGFFHWALCCSSCYIPRGAGCHQVTHLLFPVEKEDNSFYVISCTAIKNKSSL